MRNYILIAIIIAIFLIAGILSIIKESDSTGQYQQNQVDRILEVRLQVLAPFSTATLLIDSQGAISYEASAPDAGIEKQADSMRITKQQFDDLSDLIVKNEFWSFKEQYADENLTDATTYIVGVKSISPYSSESVDPKVYSVSCYGDCPGKIVEIINKIKELWGKEILEVGV